MIVEMVQSSVGALIVVADADVCARGSATTLSQKLVNRPRRMGRE